MIEGGPSCRDDIDRPDVVLECIDWGRSGEDAIAGREEGTRRGTCRKVEDLRDDDSEDNVGLGPGPGDVCGVEAVEDGPEAGTVGNGSCDTSLTCISGVGIGSIYDCVATEDGGDASGSVPGDGSALLGTSFGGSVRSDTVLVSWEGRDLGETPGEDVSRWATKGGVTSVMETVLLDSSIIRTIFAPIPLAVGSAGGR